MYSKWKRKVKAVAEVENITIENKSKLPDD
jgi:hypothetical protein